LTIWKYVIGCTATSNATKQSADAGQMASRSIRSAVRSTPLRSSSANSARSPTPARDRNRKRSRSSVAREYFRLKSSVDAEYFRFSCTYFRLRAGASVVAI